MPKKYTPEEKESFNNRLDEINHGFALIGSEKQKFTFIRFHHPHLDDKVGRARIYNTFKKISLDFKILDAAEHTLRILNDQKKALRHE